MEVTTLLSVKHFFRRNFRNNQTPH